VHKIWYFDINMWGGLPHVYTHTAYRMFTLTEDKPSVFTPVPFAKMRRSRSECLQVHYHDA